VLIDLSLIAIKLSDGQSRLPKTFEETRKQAV
jgi:hypothetical protein